MTPERQYVPLPNYRTKDAIEQTLAAGSYEELMVLSLAVGQNWPDWQYAQSLCLRLADHPDAAIRANACLGLSYIARTKGRLEHWRVKPVLLRELRTQSDYKWLIEYAIDDINYYLGWHIARKQRTPNQTS
jgi:hypothetical protein